MCNHTSFGNNFQEFHSQKKACNALHLKESRFLKKEERSPELIKSQICEGYIIPLGDNNLIEKYSVRFELDPIYDPLMDEPVEIRRLMGIRSWKSEFLLEKTKKLLSECNNEGILLKDVKDTGNAFLQTLLMEAEGLKEEIRILDKEIDYQKTNRTNNEKWPELEEFKEELHPVWVHGSFVGRGSCRKPHIYATW